MHDVDLAGLRRQSARRGHKKGAFVACRSGRYVRAVPFEEGERLGDVAVDATLRAAASRSCRLDGHGTPPALVQRRDLRRKVRERFRRVLTIFVVDSSDSMATRARMASAKGAALGLLTTSYQKRDLVGLVAFGGDRARVVLRPTRSVSLAERRLRELAVGGATPFADGLLQAWNLVRVERLREPRVEPLLVVLSDGKANAPLEAGRDAVDELLGVAEGLRDDGARWLVIDSTTEDAGSQVMVRLATTLRAPYHHVAAMRPEELVDLIRTRSE